MQSTSSTSLPEEEHVGPKPSASIYSPEEMNVALKTLRGSSTESSDMEEEQTKSMKRRTKSYLHKYSPIWKRHTDFKN
jgi:hypothetical protein